MSNHLSTLMANTEDRVNGKQVYNSIQKNVQEKTMSFIQSKKERIQLNKVYGRFGIAKFFNKAESQHAKYQRKIALEKQRAEKKSLNELNKIYLTVHKMFDKAEKSLIKKPRTCKNKVCVYQPVQYVLLNTRIDNYEDEVIISYQFKTIIDGKQSRKTYSAIYTEQKIKSSKQQQCAYPAITNEINLAVSQPIHAKIEMEAETQLEYIEMEAGADIDSSDSDSQNDDFEDESVQENTRIQDLSSEDLQAYKIYIKELKKHTTTEVCGRRQKRTFLQLDKKTGDQINRTSYKLSDREVQRFSKYFIRGVSQQQMIRKVRKLFRKFNTTNQTMMMQFRFTLQNGSTQVSKIGDFNHAIKSIVESYQKLINQYDFDSSIVDGYVNYFERRERPNIQAQVRGGRHIIDMNKNYLIISPLSDTNCFYHCLVYYNLLAQGKFDKIVDQDYIVERAKELKRQFGNDKDYSDPTDILKVANYYGCNFTIYDNLFRKMTENGNIKGQRVSKERKSSKLINADVILQFIKNHCCLLVPRLQYPDFCNQFDKIQAKRFSQDQPIIPTNFPAKQSDRRIMTYDLEAYKRSQKCGTQVPFCIGICTQIDLSGPIPVPQYKEFYSENCIEQFFDYLSNMTFERKSISKVNKKGQVKEKQLTPEVFLYAHNGAKYDLAVINEVLLKRSDFQLIKEEFMELDGGVINQAIVNKNGVKFIFRDSARIFAGSLDGLCRDLKPYFMKQTGHKFKFDDLNADNVYNDNTIRSEISDYLKHDCLSLAQIMIQFRQKLLTDPLIQLDICDCFTSATMAKKLYFSKYYERYTKTQWVGGRKKDRQFIYHVNRETDQYIRQSYFGGRCDIYKFGTFKKVYYYDFTSLYPYVGSKYMMPIGKPVFVQGSEIDIDDFFGFIRCKVITNRNSIPLHGMKYNNKLVFANHKNTEMTLFSEEIKLGLKLGYTYEFIDGQRFERSPLLRDIMSDGFKLKAESKKKGESVMEKTWKIVINSAYGFFGLRWENKRGVKFLSGEQLDVALEEGKVFNYNQISDDGFMVDLESDMEEVKGRSIAIASAVTSYARMTLYTIMQAIQQRGHTIYYTDTDSVITDCNIKQYPEMMSKFQWDGCGDALGCVKNEALDYCKKKLNSEDLQKQIELDGNELYFDECQILAPKVYSLKKTLVNGQTITIVKSKGVKDSSYDQQTKLLEKQTITSGVMQFRSGKNAYMKDQDIIGRVTVNTVDKKLCLFKEDGSHKYSKGLIYGQNVKPLYFENGILIE